MSSGSDFSTRCRQQSSATNLENEITVLKFNKLQKLHAYNSEIQVWVNAADCDKSERWKEGDSEKTTKKVESGPRSLRSADWVVQVLVMRYGKSTYQCGLHTNAIFHAYGVLIEKAGMPFHRLSIIILIICKLPVA